MILLEGEVYFGTCKNHAVRPICLPPVDRRWRVPRDDGKVGMVTFTIQILVSTFVKIKYIFVLLPVPLNRLWAGARRN